jgi:hypothetical protein
MARDPDHAYDPTATASDDTVTALSRAMLIAANGEVEKRVADPQ